MILNFLLLFLIFLVLSSLIFFVFYFLLPAMKTHGFISESPLFSEKELHYIVHDEKFPKKTDKKAVVLCDSEKEINEDRFFTFRGQTCFLINEVYESVNDCKTSCLGLGDCVQVCPQEAIIIENGCAVVTDLCIGCGDCLEICPKDIIKLVDQNETETVLCAAGNDRYTSCSECQKHKKIPVLAKKDFKFWKTCYKLLRIEK